MLVMQARPDPQPGCLSKGNDAALLACCFDHAVLAILGTAYLLTSC